MTAAARRTPASRSPTAAACFTPGVVEVHARASAGEHAGRVGGRAAVSDEDHGCHVSDPSGTSLSRVIVDNALYHQGKRVPLGTGDDQSLGHARVPCDPGDFQWIGIHDPSPDELQLIADTFDLHPLAVEDAGDSHQRPKLERYGDTLFLVLKTLWYVDEEDAVETGEINMFVGRDFVVTVRHGEGIDLADSRRDLEQRAKVLEHGPMAVMYAICDRVVDEYERGRRGARGGRRRGRGVGLLPRPHRRLDPDLRPQAGDRRGAPRGDAAARADAAVRRRAGSTGIDARDRDLLPRRRRPPRTGSRRSSTASTSCCRPPSTATWPGSRCSRTRTCARSPRAPRWSSCRP